MPAGEGAVHEGEVSGGPEGANRPPDQANPESVGSGFCARNRKRIHGIPRGEDHRVDAESDAGQDSGQIGAGGEESLQFIHGHF